MSDPIPQLQMVRNDNADDTLVNFGVFMGKWSMVAPIAGIFFISLMNMCSSIGLDIVSSLIIALAPGVIMTVLVIVLVNTKPPGYALELAQTWWFLGRQWLYMHGYTDETPQIWYSGKPVRHPRA